MTIAVDLGHKATKQTNKHHCILIFVFQITLEGAVFSINGKRCVNDSITKEFSKDQSAEVSSSFISIFCCIFVFVCCININ